MTQEEINILWQKAMQEAVEAGEMYTRYRFAKLIAEKEREEIAQFIERTNLGSLPEETALHYANLLLSYSTAIRARG